MGFLGGSVSFSRFKLVGGSPKRLDDKLLDKLREHRIGARRRVQVDLEDVGWIAGRHVLDGDFDVEKNVLLDCLHFALRIDAAKIPPDILHAYTMQEYDALRKAGGKRTGRSAGGLWREAREAARSRAMKEMNDGRYRRIRAFPILWDTRTDVVYVAATQPAVLERLHPLFKETFDRRLEPLTSGGVGHDFAEAKGLSRAMESARPSAFVELSESDGRGEVLWTRHDPASRDFLGNEFLIWLWHRLSEHGSAAGLPDGTEAEIVFVKQLALECPWGEYGKVSITADGPTQLPESRRAIATGKLPRKAGFILSRQGDQYEFVLQAETLNVSSAILPKIEPQANGNGSRGHGGTNSQVTERAGPESGEAAAAEADARGGVNPRVGAEERIEQVRHLAKSVDLLFQAFLQVRLSSRWEQTLEEIRSWVQEARSVMA